jgi:L-threonylcarbamoyladenylate synthase
VLSAQSPDVGHKNLAWRSAATDPAQFARDLYARLREIDALACDVILVTVPPADDAWRAVTDRLRRAAAGSK